MAEPSLLYHYTSISSLCLILKHRQLMFRRLDLVNDPLDGFSSDFVDSQKIVYVSCFTAREDDALPMWAMYTNDLAGVRIGFPPDLFGAVSQHRFGMNIRSINKSYIPGQDSTMLCGPDEVQYRPTIAEIDHHLVTDHGHAKSFDTFEIGRYKLDDWKFEQEYRFKIFAIDYKFGGLLTPSGYDSLMDKMKSQIRPDIARLLVDIEPSVFSEVHILLGPRTTEADLLTVEAIVKAFCPEIAQVSKSSKKVN